MFVGIGQPFLASHNVRDSHFPVVDDIGKVEGRPTVVSDYHKII